MLIKRNTILTQLVEYTDSELDSIQYALDSLPHRGEEEPPSLLFNVDGKPTLHTGLIPFLPTLLLNINIIDVDDSWRIGKLCTVDPSILAGCTLRDYQVNGIKKALYYGRGIVQVATGGGKSLIMAGVIAHLRREGLAYTVLVLVPSGFLMQQIAEVFEASGLGSVCQIGYGSKYREGADIYIAVINSAYRACTHNPDWIIDPDILIIDECHHLSAESYVYVCERCQAKYRYAFTATAFEDPRFYSYEDLKLIGLTGPIIYNVKSKDLIARGHLASPLVTMLDYSSKKIPTWNWQGVYNSGIVNNKARNDLICSTAIKCYEQGNKVLIFVGRLKHGHLLAKQIKDSGTECIFIHGGSQVWLYTSWFDKRSEHWEMSEIAQYVNSKEQAIIITSTVLDESADLPTVNVLIMATALRKYRRTIQRCGRGMRAKPGSNRVFIFDFNDRNHVFLDKQSQYRLLTYRTEEFEISPSIKHTLGIMSKGEDDTMLEAMLSLAVPLKIYELKAMAEKDRPSPDDTILCIECNGEGRQCATCGGDSVMDRRDALSRYIAAHGDVILYKGKKQGETAKAFNVLVESLALLSFTPDGVKFLNLTFRAE